MATQGWIFARYEDPAIKPSMCSPLYHATRAAYVLKTYGARVKSTRRAEVLHLDFGGMISIDDDTTVNVSLGAYRSFSCWRHQVNEAIGCLEKAPSLIYGRSTYYRFARWPGVLCFISATDRRKVLRALARKSMRSRTLSR